MFHMGWVCRVCCTALPFTGVSVGFRFHTHLCFIYTHLFCYLRLSGYLTQQQPLHASVRGAWNEFAHVVQSHLLGTSKGTTRFVHLQAAQKSELQKEKELGLFEHGGSSKFWCLEAVDVLKLSGGTPETRLAAFLSAAQLQLWLFWWGFLCGDCMLWPSREGFVWYHTSLTQNGFMVCTFMDFHRNHIKITHRSELAPSPAAPCWGKTGRVVLQI